MSVENTFSVLLVDDDANMRSMFQMVMQHHHTPLVTCTDAETALDYLDQHTPNVIVMDIMLPGLDGYQALNAIRNQSLAPTAPVIATSAYYTADTPANMLAAGFSGFIAKPFSPQTILQYLQTVADGFTPAPGAHKARLSH